jgi:hypothetical protein
VPEIDELTELLADAHHMPTAMLPRPRTAEPKVIDLAALDVTIPASAAALVDGYGDYGS